MRHTQAVFHLALTALIQLFHPCYLSNVEQGQMMLVSAASAKWNAASVIGWRRSAIFFSKQYFFMYTYIYYYSYYHKFYEEYIQFL